MLLSVTLRRRRARGTVLMTAAAAQVAFIAVSADVYRLEAPLTLLTVAALRNAGLTLIGATGATGLAAVAGAPGRSLTFDLAKIPEVDSAGLALLIDWLASARACGCQLRYVKPGKTLLALARLSEVEPLLTEGAPPPVKST